MVNKCPQCNADNPSDSKYCKECATPLPSRDTAGTKTFQTPLPASDKTIAGKYRILAELGRGGMGIVYKAEDTRLKRLVALKFLPEELTRDQEAKKRFDREAQAAAALDHPNICTIHEIDEEEGKTFISMAYVSGQTLREKLSSGTFKMAESVRAALQIAYGLREAHEKKIVHRDIKPANIMLTDKGDVKVMDFGIAKWESGEDLTKPATILGTAAYMSPEQAQGKTVDVHTDIWSFGVVFYEMLTGKSPFKRGTEQVSIHAILNEEPKPLAGSLPGIPKSAEEIILKCLEKDPAERYQTAKELIESLEQLARESGLEGISTLHGIGEGQAKKRRIFFTPLIILFCILIAALGYVVLTSGKKKMPDEKPRLVVLPFENLGHAEDDYFADGMTEEITSQLAKIGSLAVISRTSALLYAGSDKSIQQIGEELDVDYALEGTVRWAPTSEGRGRVKITPQLIQVSDDTHVWADSFDRIFEDIFEIQNDIAQKVVEALGITLLEGEQEAVAKRPTENIGAYQAFLRGRYLAGRPHFTEENWKHAIQSFQQAVGLDPGFGQAYAELAKAHARFYYLRADLSQDRLESAQAAANKALEFAPDSPEVHLALSYYYLWAQRDNLRALAELEKAEELIPDNAEILTAKASYFEALGRFEEGIDVLKRALVLSPRDVSIFAYLSGFYWVTRQYTQGIEAANRAIELGPEEAWPYLYKIFNLWSGGVTEESRAVIEAMPQDHSWALWVWFWQEVGEGNFQAAMDRLSTSSSDWIRLKTWARPIVMFEAFVYDYSDEKEKALSAYEKAKTMLEAEVLKQLNDPRMHSSLGIALAALGFKEDAVREGKKATELLPINENPFYGVCYIQDLALIYLLIGEYESALDEIEFLLSTHSWVSIPFLEMNPYWKRFHDYPRYQKMVEKYTFRQ